MSVEFKPSNMPFRRLGSSGLRVPLFSLGGWLTFGGQVNGDVAKEILKTAFENGINMFDVAESYGDGQCEIDMGRTLKELGYRRSDFILTTKLFWGTRAGPNNGGLSRKHIIEGTKECLDRLQVDYVDVIFAHRLDHTIPMEEIVRAFNWVIQKGWAFYWATSEWSAYEIEEAHHVATRLGLVGPIAEQCRHNMFVRERPEKEYEPLYRKYDLGTMVFSALGQGILTGKYNNGVPPDSRLAVEKGEQHVGLREWLESEVGQARVVKVRQLSEFAEKELGCTVSHLALAWLAVKPTTSTIILGASKPEQILDNLKSLELIPKLTPAVLEKLETILDSKPSPRTTFGRPEIQGALPTQ